MSCKIKYNELLRNCFCSCFNKKKNLENKNNWHRSFFCTVNVNKLTPKITYCAQSIESKKPKEQNLRL